MWSRDRFWSLLCGMAVACALLAWGLQWFVCSAQQAALEREVDQRLRALAWMARTRLDDSPATSAADTVAALQRQLAGGEAWITLYAGDGRELADSRESSLPTKGAPNADPLPASATSPWLLTSRDALTGERFRHATLRAEHSAPIVFAQASVSLAEVDRAIGALRAWLWLGSATVMAAAFGLVVYIYWLVLHPVVRMARGAQAIAAGDFAQPLEDHADLGLLGAAFQQMQRELSHRVNQLRENHERLATVLGSMVEGVLAVDSEQRVMLANIASGRLLDFSQPDAVGRPLIEVCRQRGVREAIAAALEHAEPYSAELEVTGVPRKVLLLRAARLPGEPCPGAVLVLHDVTELRRLENLRREFVANVSHELKTPLSSIKAYAETLRLGAINDAEHNLTFVQRIEEQADRLFQLILDLLQIARMESGQEAFFVQDVPLADTIEEVKTSFANAAAAKRISLSLEPPESPLLVKADEEGLITILNNLVDNALKYTPEGGAVTVRWKADGDFALLDVVDTGIGIAPKDQARVFERFFRADKARSREIGGTGLGLSIVKHLAQAFGGSVGIESTLGKGSTFRVRVPLA